MDAPLDSMWSPSIDWSQQQPFGVFRCTNGWSDTAGNEINCRNQGVVEATNGQLYCHPCAMVATNSAICDAVHAGMNAANGLVVALEGIGDNLATLVWQNKPWYQRVYFHVRARLAHRPERAQ